MTTTPNETRQSYSELGLLPPDGTLAVVLMDFGSHLYGTNTESSDRDYKGVFMPAVNDILMGRIPRSITRSTRPVNATKNTSRDVEVEWFSLHQFVKLALEGQTTAIDMLHAGAESWHHATDEWLALHQRRHAFYTKNLRAFVGYARRQAAKYGIKGSRLATARNVLAFMEQVAADNEGNKVEYMRAWIEHNDLQHVHVTDEHLEVCGRKLQWNARVSLYLDGMRRFVRNYGERAQQAESNQGIDWKAMSHALRAGYEVRAMLRDGDFRFPLPEVDIIKRVKAGAFTYNEAASLLEQVMDECELLSESSTLPDHPNVRLWESWLVSRTANYLNENMRRALSADHLDTVR